MVVELVLERVARAAGAGALRAAALDHEVGDHAVEGEPVVEPVAGELAEVLDRLRRVVVEELDRDRAGIGVKRGLRTSPATLVIARASYPAAEDALPVVRQPQPSRGSLLRLVRDAPRGARAARRRRRPRRPGDAPGDDRGSLLESRPPSAAAGASASTGRATREAGDREVAVAVFETEGIEETVLARARREAQAMGKLGEHPHVVRVLDSGEEDGVPFIVSEYVGGGDLAGALEDCEGRRLEIERAIAIAIDVCRALEHAHSRGIVHRDLKPANVWLGDDGAARLGDFGLATTDRRLASAVEGMLVGTVAYLPPEQALGRHLGRALGPLLARRDALRAAHRRAAVPGRGRGRDHRPAPERASRSPPSRHRPEIPPALDRLVLELLAKSPDDRPAERGRGAARARGRAEQPAADESPDGAENPLEGSPGASSSVATRELDQMRDVLEDALGGEGRLLLVCGDPGIGKTRTAEQLATYAGVRGAACTGVAATRPRARRRTGRGRRRSAPTSATPTRSACAGSSAAGRRTSPRSCPSSPSGSATSASRRRWSPSRRGSGSSTRSPASSAAPRVRGRW